MKVYTNNQQRQHGEMQTIWGWMTDNFGPPENHSIMSTRWRYGKDIKEFINGTWDIEWFDFTDEKDATAFIMRWL